MKDSRKHTEAASAVTSLYFHVPEIEMWCRIAADVLASNRISTDVVSNMPLLSQIMLS